MLKELTPKSIAQYAASAEETGIALYEKLTEKFGTDASTKACFDDFHKSAQANYKQFMALTETPSGDAPADHMAGYVKAMSASSFFDREGLLAKVVQLKSDNDAQAIAMGFEKASLAFYQATVTAMGIALGGVIDAKRKHIATLFDIVASQGTAFRAGGDRWW